MVQLVEKIPNMKIMIVYDDHYSTVLPKKYQESKVKINLLNSKYAAQLLKAFDVDEKYFHDFSLDQLEQHRIFKD